MFNMPLKKYLNDFWLLVILVLIIKSLFNLYKCQCQSRCFYLSENKK